MLNNYNKYFKTYHTLNVYQTPGYRIKYICTPTIILIDVLIMCI